MLETGLGLLFCKARRQAWPAKPHKPCDCFLNPSAVEAQECAPHEPERRLFSSDPVAGNCVGGTCGSWTAAANAASSRIFRRELPHFPGVSLRSSLVQSLE